MENRHHLSQNISPKKETKDKSCSGRATIRINFVLILKFLDKISVLIKMIKCINYVMIKMVLNYIVILNRQMR